MDKKLTLSINSQVIQQAKEYAKSKNTSLSKMIEAYFETIIDSEVDTNEITPLVKSLSGVGTLPKDFNYKKSKSFHIINKHK